MSNITLKQIKELIKHIKENPQALKEFEELYKSAQKDPYAKPIFSEKILKPSDKESAVVLNPNVKKPLANAEDSKHIEMEMSSEDQGKKRVGELTKRIKACIEKMQMDKIQKESMDKDDKPHAPGTAEDKAHDVAEEGESVNQALEELKDKGADSKEKMLSHLRTLKDKSQLRSEKNKEAGKQSHEKFELQKEDDKSLRLLGQLESAGVSPTPQGKRYFRALRGLKNFGHEHKGVGRKIYTDSKLDSKRAVKEHQSKLDEIKELAAPSLPKKEMEKRCWEGYEPTPGKKPYSKGSCRPVKKKVLDKAQPETVPTTKIVPPVIPSGSGNGGNKPKKPFKKPLMNSEMSSKHKIHSFKNVLKSKNLAKKQKVLVGGRVLYTDRSPKGPHQVLAYNIKEKAKSKAKRKPKKTQVKKNEQYYTDLIKKVLDN